MVLESLEALGGTVPSMLEPILLELEGGRYLGPILLGVLAFLLAVRRPGDTRGGNSGRCSGCSGSSSGSSGFRGGGGGGIKDSDVGKSTEKAGAYRGSTRV